MSNREPFAGADIIFADGERSVRQGIRQILTDQGYRSLRDYGDLDIVEDEIKNTLPDLIVMDSMMDRISAVAYHRKPFVVTSDYIGPDRRTKEA